MRDLEYNIESISETYITGWAYFPSTPDEYVSIDITHRDALIGTVSANIFRTDLNEKGIGKGDHAFRFDIPNDIIVESTEEIKLFQTESKKQMKSGKDNSADMLSRDSDMSDIPQSSELEKLRSGVEELIKNALNEKYNSYSCKDSILTGNSYQTVYLGNKRLGGFRTDRQNILQLFDLEGKSVLDLGCNLGELTRQSRYGGSSYACGVEYDEFFALIANLINVYNNLSSIDVIHGDITGGHKFDREFDVILAFSVFTYIGTRLADLARITKEMAVFETHNIGSDWRKSYLEPIAKHFKYTTVFGETEWGTAEKFADGKRLLIAASHKRLPIWNLFFKLQEAGGPPPNGHIDLTKSTFSVFQPLRDWLEKNDLSQVTEVDPDVTMSEAFDLPDAPYMNAAAYWLEFYRGYCSYRAAGRVVPENSYYRYYRNLLQTNPKYDPGAAKACEDEDHLNWRILERFKNMHAMENVESTSSATGVGAILCINQTGENGNRIIVDHNSGNAVSYESLDGYHRLGAGYLMKKSVIPYIAVELISP